MSEFRRSQIVRKHNVVGDDYIDSSNFRGFLDKASNFIDGFQSTKGFPKQISQKVVRNKIHDKADSPLIVNGRKDYFKTFKDYASIPGENYRKMDYLTPPKKKITNDFETFNPVKKQMTRYHDGKNWKRNPKLIIPQNSNTGWKDLNRNKNYFYEWVDNDDKMSNVGMEEKLFKRIIHAPLHTTEEPNLLKGSNYKLLLKEQRNIKEPNFSGKKSNFHKYSRKSFENHSKKNYDSGNASKSPNLGQRSMPITGLRSPHFDQKDARKHVSHVLLWISENQRRGLPKTYPRSLIRTKHWEKDINGKPFPFVETSTNGYTTQFELQQKIEPTLRRFTNSYILFVGMFLNLLLLLIFYFCQRWKKIGPVLYKRIEQPEEHLGEVSPTPFRPTQSHTESVVVNIQDIDILPFLDVLAYNGYLNPNEDFEPSSLQQHAGTSTRSSLASELMMTFDSPDQEFSFKSDVPHETQGNDLNISQASFSPGIGSNEFGSTDVSDPLETSNTKKYQEFSKIPSQISMSNCKSSENVQRDGLSSSNSSILETWNSKCGYDT